MEMNYNEKIITFYIMKTTKLLTSLSWNCFLVIYIIMKEPVYEIVGTSHIFNEDKHKNRQDIPGTHRPMKFI